MFHCNGWMFPYSLTAMAGTSYFLRQVRPEAMFDLIEKYQIQYFAGAPVTMNTMLAYPHRKKFTHKMECWVAGAPPPPAVIKRFESEIGITVRPAYGLTETYGPICTHAVDQDWLNTNGNATSITDEELLMKRTFLSCDTTVEELQVGMPLLISGTTKTGHPAKPISSLNSPPFTNHNPHNSYPHSNRHIHSSPLPHLSL